MTRKGTDRRAAEDFVNDLIATLDANELLHRDTLRSTVWKIIDDFSKRLKKCSERQHWSKEVMGAVEKTGNWKPSEYRFEHVVPTGIIVEYLAPYDQSSGLPERTARNEFITNFFSRWLAVCWVTKEEDKRLNTAAADSTNPQSTGKLKHRMPVSFDGKYTNWDEKFENRWERYAAAGIEPELDTIKTKEFIRRYIDPNEQCR